MNTNELINDLQAIGLKVIIIDEHGPRDANETISDFYKRQWETFQSIPVLPLDAEPLKAGEAWDPKAFHEYCCMVAKRAIVGTFGTELFDGVETAIVDLLTNLRHLCAAIGIDFEEVEERSFNHYQEEREIIEDKGEGDEKTS